MESGLQKQGPAHGYFWDPVALSRNSAQASNSAGVPTTLVDMWESQRKAPAPVPRWFPLSEGRPWGMCAGRMPYSRIWSFPTQMGTRWPAVSLHQLLPLCSASPSHRQLVWGTTLQKKKHIDLTVHWGTRLLCSLENMTYKGWLKELGCLV